MRKFIPISIFKELYSNQSDLLSEDGMASFHEKLMNDGSRIAQEAGFSTEDLVAFMETLRNPSNVVFYGWIEQNGALKDALLGKKRLLYVDSAKHLEHTLAKSYQKFLSPLLSDLLLKTPIYSDSERRIAFSYVQLLDDDHRAVVENQLFKLFQEELVKLKSVADRTTEEQELVNFVTPMCSDDIIACVNYLSRASYAIKLGYVDKILDTIHSKACTVRFANWILERMSQVELNKEHNYKLSDLRKDLRQGNLSVKNHKKGRTPIRWKTIFTMLLLTILVGGAIYLIVYKPFNEIEEPEISNRTSFREFSKEERIRMDSLLREMDNPFENPDEIDPLTAPVQMGVDVDLVLRKSFKNEKMEAIYNDLMADVELKEAFPTTDCPPAQNSVFKSTSSVKSLDFSKGMHTAVVRNESAYDVIVYVAESSERGAVYASLIKPNETIEFSLNKFNTMMVVAGTKYQKYQGPAGAKGEELPSDDFTHHFCDTDLNYAETINTCYQFMYPREGKNKFMVMGATSGYVHLLDVHSVLETY